MAQQQISNEPQPLPQQQQQHHQQQQQPLQQRPDALLARFGTSTYYEESFESIQFLNPRNTFMLLEETKRKSSQLYEQARQRYLKLLGQHKVVWQPTNRLMDSEVEVSRIYRDQQQHQYIAFMRIKPKGSLAERLVSSSMELNFHLLLGRTVFVHRRRPRTMSRGGHITVGSRSAYAIKCLGNEPAYFVFQVLLHKPSAKKRRSKMLAIELPPPTLGINNN